MPFSIHLQQSAVSIAAAAPRQCPVIDFVELQGVLSLKILNIDLASVSSFASVPVP